MESSADGDESEARSASALMRRWVDVGRVLEKLAPELFRRTLAANEVTVVVLSDGRGGAS